MIVIIAAVLLIVLSYAAYLLIDYERIENEMPLSVADGTSNVLKAGEEYTAITYNIGFAAYTPDFGFFMDGGTESRAKSEKSVVGTMSGICDFLSEKNADFMLLQEVDKKATRSYYVDQQLLIEESMSGYDSVFAVNYDSSYLFYPFTQPHGKSLSGMLTLSKYDIYESVRYSLPIEETLMKFLDLDRCYSVSRVPVDNGKELVIFTIHLSAYTSDGTIATEQLELLIAEMGVEYEAGNYVLCGGDFNKDLLGDSGSIFGVSGEDYTWAQPFPENLLDGTGLSLVSSLGSDPTPSCRNADGPYTAKQFVLTVDGFIVSDNIDVKLCEVEDLDFMYSDHNPVSITFIPQS